MTTASATSWALARAAARAADPATTCTTRRWRSCRARASARPRSSSAISKIGYNRAATIVERMESEGVVSQANHVGKREVLVGDHSER